MRPLILAVFASLLPSMASAFDAQETTVAPVDMRFAVPALRQIGLPQQLPNLNIPDMSRLELQRLDAIAPVQTVPVVPEPGAGPQKAKAQPDQAVGKKAVTGSLQNFAGAIADDEKQGGGQTGSLSGTFFDSTLALPETQAIPHAEGVDLIAHEIEAPPEMLRAHGIQATVAVYGSARIPSPQQALAFYKQTIEKYGRKPKVAEGQAAIKAAREAIRTSQYYTLARRFGALVARGGRGKIAVVTGGGPGIMEGANRGASEAGGPSVGYNIKLEHEQALNPYVTPGLSFEFEHFPSRQMSMRHGALAMVYFPGGFGTMYEFFEVMTLVQTHKIARQPIVLVGEKSYWDQILDFKKFVEMGMISPEDLKLFRYADTAEEAWAIVREQSRPARL